ncbi:Bgt-51609 [Blumeria graminis f. sp. tritici]|uniref:Bgt-51609 n=1 Tax=Blumeria graminis f. sp. tritici TaxID=62690 RepID=A0A9X9MP01_BLUGR|nr:Bgt-51609 [Blumeria graminis f. sp. tritici]
MKDCIQRHHLNLGCGKQQTQDSLCNIVKEAWDPMSSEDLVRLIQSMPARYQAVIDADWGPTRYQGLKIFQPKVQIQG